MRTTIFIGFLTSQEIWNTFFPLCSCGILITLLTSLPSLLTSFWFLLFILLLSAGVLLALWLHYRKNYKQLTRWEEEREQSLSYSSATISGLSGAEQRGFEIKDQELQDQARHLVKLHHELNMANQDIEIFLYKAYHNFLGPIATIRGVCNVAVLDGQEEAADSYFSQINRVADNMQTMLEKLLEISVIHDHSLSLESVRLTPFLVDYQKAQPYTENSILAHLHLSFAENVQIYADTYLLKAAIEKIIFSAHRFRPNRTHILAEVFVKYHETEDYDVIQLKEYDLALPTDMIDNLFKMFHRSTTEPDDHGLGFYAARYAVRRMGGDISIESGAGYITFCIRLPKFNPQHKTSDRNTFFNRQN